MATRWGILGAGKISRDFVRAVCTLPDTEHKVVAVAARSRNRAIEFAESLNIATAYGSYEELANDPYIDVVYIGTIHPHHADQCKMMLRAGKPVLCEKPFCMNQQEASEVITLAKEKKLFLMEAFWSRCFPAYQKLREEMVKGTIGDVRILNAQLGMIVTKQEALLPELGGGALYALGCYNIQLSDMVFGEEPSNIIVSGTLLPTGVDDSTTIILLYPGGKMATLTTSLSCDLNQRATLQGSKGIIEFPNWMYCPSEIVVNGHTTQYPLPEPTHPVNYVRSQGMIYEAQHVRNMLLEGTIESPLMTHESTLRISHIMDEVRKQLGLK